MQQQLGDIWELAKGNSICITTNGNVNAKGHLVMGKGIAKEALIKHPSIGKILGERVELYGNHVEFIPIYDANLKLIYNLFTFPTKHNWWEKSSFDLIEQSCKELVEYTITYTSKIYLPRPGCGNGGLNWEDVKPILEKYFDNRFIIVSKD